MRAASAGLAAFLDLNTRGIYRHLVTITLADSTVIRWTDHETDLVVSGDTFAAGGAGTAPLIKVGRRRDPAGTEIGECELVLLCGDTAELNGTSIPFAVVNDVFDRAKVKIERVFGVDSIDLTLGTMRIFDGVVAESDPSSTQVTLSLVDPREELGIELPRTPIQPPCTARLFDSQCSLVKATYTETATVAGGSTAWKVRTDRTRADGYFTLGVLTFSGSTATVALRGVKRAIRGYLNTNGEFEVDEALPATPAAGDTFTAFPGCDLKFTTCGTKFSNQVHFRGFPLLPAETSDTRARYNRSPGSLGGVPVLTGWEGIAANVSPPDLVLPIVYGRQKVRGQVVYRFGPYSSQNGTTVIVAFAEGPIVGGRRFWISDKFYSAVSDLAGYGGPAPGGSVLYLGARPTQSAWAWMNTIDPTYYPVNYPGVAFWGASYRKIPAGSAETYELEVDGFLSDAADAGASGDAHPASIIGDATYGLLPNATFGAGFTWPVITDTGTDGIAASSARRYITAAGLLLSPVIDSKRKAIEILQELLESCNCSCRMADGSLQIVPLGDVSFTGNGVTYSPDTAVQYALTEDDYLTGGTEDPVAVKRPARETVYNIVPVEFTEREGSEIDPGTGKRKNPGSAYTSRQVEVPEPLDVANNGPRRGGAVSLPAICLPDVAVTISAIRAQRAVKRRNVYTFKLGWRFMRLQPLDYLSISDRCFGLTSRVVRIRSIEEDGDVLTIEAEDAPIGMNHAVAHEQQSSESGYLGAPFVDSQTHSEMLALRNWTARTVPSGVWHSVVWSEALDIFSAVGQGPTNYAATSPDGISWTVRAAGTFGSLDHCWAPEIALFVAVDGSRSVMTSPDGVTWTIRPSVTPLACFVSAVAWNGSVFAAVGTSAATSPDGVTWTGQTIPAGPWDAICWAGDRFVAVGSGGACATSPDGVTWTARTIPAGGYYALAWNGSVVCAVGGSSVCATSPDGITWTSQTVPAVPGGARWLRDIVWTGRLFLSVDYTPGAASSVAFMSADGVTWSASFGSIPSADFLAVGWSGHSAVVLGGARGGGTAGASSLAVV